MKEAEQMELQFFNGESPGEGRAFMSFVFEWERIYI